MSRPLASARAGVARTSGRRRRRRGRVRCARARARAREGDDVVDAFGRRRLPWREGEGDDVDDDDDGSMDDGVRLGNASAFMGWEVYLDDDPETLVGVVTDVASTGGAPRGDAEAETSERTRVSDDGDEGGKTVDGETLNEDERAFLRRLDDALFVDEAYDDDAFDSDEEFLLLVEGLEETSLGERPLHYVPFVPSMFPRWIPNAQALFLDPPAGLLELATREVRLNELRNDLLPFSRMLGTDAYGMPQRLSLIKQGYRDLVKRVESLGDWREVALELDLKPDAAPWYYWDNIDNLEQALLKLVDAFWFEEMDGDETFWYNDISGALRVDPPVDGDGGGLDVPVMPTMANLVEARRWDLHHAVVLHGGYRAVAKELGWQQARRMENRHLLSFETLRDEILELLEDESLVAHGLRPGQLPCAAQLEEIERDDLVKFIRVHGGFGVVAKRLKLELSKWGRVKYPTAVAAAAALRQFSLEHNITTRASPRLNKVIVFVPSDTELFKHGRNDLRHALRLFTPRVIADVGKMSLRQSRMSYEEARVEMRSWKFETGKRSVFLNWCKAGNKPWNMPKDPQVYYSKSGDWVSWEDFMLE